MNAAVVAGDRTGKKGLGPARGALLLGLIAALALLLAPSNASAQIIPVPGEGDRCSDRSSGGKFTVPNSGLAYVNISNPGPGTVTASMYGTKANCIRGPAECPPGSNCRLEVQTVCEFHCLHDHTAPYYWTVRLAATPTAGGQFFVGWTGDCVPTKSADRSDCIVRMSRTADQNVAVHFGPSDDMTPPTAPTVTAVPASYAVNLSWTPSVDPEGRLAGYDVYRGTTHLTRVAAGETSYKVTNIFCGTTYTFHVEAFDWSGNALPSAPVTTTTGDCATGSGGLRPNTAIHVKPPKVTRKRTAYFHFGAAGETAATKFQCKLNRNRWVRCSGSAGKTYRRLAPGRYHTFRVRAGNAAGWDPTPARYTWRIRR